MGRPESGPRSSHPRLVYAVTSPLTGHVLLKGQLAHLRHAGFDVHLVCAPGPSADSTATRECVPVETVDLVREISPLRDLLVLIELYRLWKRLRPQLINASTPKAGLLALVSAWLARVPIRIYLLRGLRLETSTGLKRKLLTLTEKITVFCSTQVQAVSPSLAQRFEALGLAPLGSVRVVGPGSSNGVDVARFEHAATGVLSPAATELRQELGLSAGCPLIGFVGRLVADKGIDDLLLAFDAIKHQIPDAHLVLVGGLEEGDPIATTTRAQIKNDPRITHTGHVEDIVPYYELFGVLAFPSYREGFPNAPLEAAAAARPTVGYRVVGTVDAIEDGVTGRLVTCGDIQGFGHELVRYLEDSNLRRQHGRAARQRVERNFRRENVWQAIAEEYRRLLLDT